MKLSQHVGRTGLVAGLAITAASAVAFAVPTTARAAPPPKPHTPGVTPRNASCGHAAPLNYDNTISGHTKTNNVNIRTGSSTSCTSVGQAQANQKLDYYCFTQGNDGYGWDYVKDLATGKQGWLRSDLLSNSGSYVLCPFL